MSIKPWREIIHPHHDVTEGRYRQAEFAADLAQVLRGSAETEYADCQEFFARTYMTDGMARLLKEALLRLSGASAEPVVQLKTAFGGGKTHTMLALYHLLNGDGGAAKISAVKELLQEAGLKTAPKARMAVIVGSALSASQPHKDMAGNEVTVRTLWGEMAAQLGGAEAYKAVAADDKAGTAPDSSTLVGMFAKLGPCLILADELVTFVRNLWQVKEEVVAGTFDANLSFIHALTEAVKASPKVQLVASIPQSEIEVGGAGGKEALSRLEHIFGRIEVIWKAADASDGFQIVRRRLFGKVLDEKACDETCRAFSSLYSDNPSDFPPEAQTNDYLKRMRDAYPIHPEVFDRLYEDWGVLDNFQRTRGVLRLMATVIEELWQSNDQAAMIMPGSLPLNVPRVREELTKYLSQQWGSVVDSDVDGELSEPFKIDQSNARFGAICAARKVARTIFLGSAPSVREQRVRGLDAVRVKLGVAAPDDPLATFSDALSRLQDRLSHLYEGGGRYWYDERPNLRRTMEEKAARISDDEVEDELVRRIKDDRTQGSFRGVHACVASADIKDEQEVRLVVLAPDYPHRPGKDKSPAIEQASEVLQQRGNVPRQYKNMLLFVAPDEDIRGIGAEVRQYLAWKAIVEDYEALNLDAQQVKQAKENGQRSGETVNIRLREAYRWLLVPTQDGIGPIHWDISRISGTESFVKRASDKATQNEQLITNWGAMLLKRELDQWLWGDEPHITTQKLWEFLTTHLYLPRLQEEAVLLAAIREGIKSQQFGYALGVEEDGSYRSLVFGHGIAAVQVSSNAVVIRPEVAQEQATKPTETQGPSTTPTRPGRGPAQPPLGGTEDGGQPAAPTAPTRFYGVVTLDSGRVGKDAGQIAEEVLSHLVGLVGAEVKVTLDIEARLPAGFADNVVRTVKENCTTLGFEQAAFEDE